MSLAAPPMQDSLMGARTSRLWIFEKLCWAGVLVCGTMLAWDFAFPPDLVIQAVVDAGEVPLEEPVYVRLKVTNRTGEEVRILGGNFG